MVSLLLWLTGAALLAGGAVMVFRGLAGQTEVRRELSAQKIRFPAAAGLPPALTRYAERPVVTGEQARAYAELIGGHVASATGGRTYAELADEWQATGRTDERLGRLRETAFMGQTLRGSLLGAYQAWQVTLLVIGLGGLLGAVGLVFLTMAATGR